MNLNEEVLTKLRSICICKYYTEVKRKFKSILSKSVWDAAIKYYRLGVLQTIRFISDCSRYWEVQDQGIADAAGV